jgi:hypothetical protein
VYPLMSGTFGSILWSKESLFLLTLHLQAQLLELKHCTFWLAVLETSCTKRYHFVMGHGNLPQPTKISI